jgi:hypothetical protein
VAHEIYLLGNQPVTCPKCGVRTDWTNKADGSQAHTCLGCGFQFIALDESKTPPKFTLARVRLNGGGYDRRGQYYGIGQPLYQAQCEDIDDGYAWVFRADNRADAKDQVHARYPAATFYR